MSVAMLGKFVARAWHLDPQADVRLLLLVCGGTKLVALPGDLGVLDLVPLDPYGREFNADGAHGFAHGFVHT